MRVFVDGLTHHKFHPRKNKRIIHLDKASYGGFDHLCDGQELMASVMEW